MSISKYLTPKVDEKLYNDIFNAVLYAVLEGATKETPMHEVREKMDIAGTYVGRVFGVLYHQGPVAGDMLMSIRRLEEEMKERFNGSVIDEFRPGGKLLPELNNISPIK